ncbi:MAG: RNA polymerase sigma factor [Acidobacteria bacterium]|nr:RNA polymerase sigma factor [Acidobacteriota bacterium]
MEDIEELYRQNAKKLFRYLFCLCGDRQLAEELLQETFYQAITSIFRFKGDSKVSTWLYRIARNVYLKHLSRTRKERLTSLDEAVNAAAPWLSEAENVEQERGDRLAEAIARLNHPFREIVFLRVFNELSFREVGEVFARSEGWARINFYRAKLQVKAILSHEYEEVS